MAVVTLKRWNISIGTGQPLAVIAGLNVLEDIDLALKVGGALKAACAELGLPYVFKASFDKANRSSIKSYRGPGLKEGLRMLAEIKAQLDVPVCTDLHEIDQAQQVAEVAEVVQIPAFLCRQTDLIVAAARATAAKGGVMHVKKAQFLAPWDCKNIIHKAREAAPDLQIMLCERGSSFGYNNLVVDMLAIPAMQALGVPVTIDATHAVLLPGAASRALWMMFLQSQGARNWAFFTCITPPLAAVARAAATIRSVWRHRNAGICTSSATSATGSA